MNKHMKLGSELSKDAQHDCLATFTHRFTRQHTPDWACELMPNGETYRVQFDSDADWLAHTYFAVKADGTLDGCNAYCESHPTWPDGRLGDTTERREGAA